MKQLKTKQDMLEFLKNSLPRDRAVYYRGFLFDDRQDEVIYKQKREAIDVADFAYSAYEQSLCTLMQKRHGDNDYEYIIESFGHGRNVSFIP